MSLPLALRPEAEDDIAEARDWYDGRQAGLGRDFVAEADATLARVEAMPTVFRPVRGDVRRVKLARFPYLVYYRPLVDRIEVLAVVHGRRDPSVWQGRA